MRIPRRSLLALPLAAVASPARARAAEDVHVVVRKATRRLELFAGSTLVRRFAIALGPRPEGSKLRRGDGATPEGDYYVTHANPRSHYHLSLGLSYPNAADATRGLARGLVSRAEHRAIVEAIAAGERPPQGTALGGDVFIHGGGTASDWTLGCVALANPHMDVLFASVPKGARVRIVP